jgi:hypothetical protein
MIRERAIFPKGDGLQPRASKKIYRFLAKSSGASPSNHLYLKVKFEHAQSYS